MSELRELIADRIRTSGPISFAEFMELSLYHPEFGYYARAARKTGRAGDFFTSVDVGPVFGQLLARLFAEMWRNLKATAQSPKSHTFDLVEAGASDGRLARDILDAAARDDPDFYAAVRLFLVERSPAARASHAVTLGPHAALLAHSEAALPEEITGIIFSNELLDALPTHAVVMTDRGLREVFVDWQESRFVERLREPSTPRIADYLSRAGAKMPQGARAEVNLAAEDWLKAAAASLRQGFLMIIDYGHEEGRLGLGAADLEDAPLKKRLAVKTLLLPGGLGSTHKVLLFGKDVGKPALMGCSYGGRIT
jgi:SAM-dependent MidA family methyltransferase